MTQLRHLLIILTVLLLPLSAAATTYSQASEIQFQTVSQSQEFFLFAQNPDNAKQYFSPSYYGFNNEAVSLDVTTSSNNQPNINQIDVTQPSTPDKLFFYQGDDAGKYKVKFHDNDASKAWFGGLGDNGQVNLVRESGAVYVTINYAEDGSQARICYNDMELRFDPASKMFTLVDANAVGNTVPAYLYYRTSNPPSYSTEVTMFFSATDVSTSTATSISNVNVPQEEVANTKYYLNHVNVRTSTSPQVSTRGIANILPDGDQPSDDYVITGNGGVNPYLTFKEGAKEGTYKFKGILIYDPTGTYAEYYYKTAATLTVNVTSEAVELVWVINGTKVTDPSKPYDYEFVINSTYTNSRNKVQIYQAADNTDVTSYFTVNLQDGSTPNVFVSVQKEWYYINPRTQFENAKLVLQATNKEGFTSNFNLPDLTINLSPANPFKNIFSGKQNRVWAEDLSLTSSSIPLSENLSQNYTKNTIEFTLEADGFTPESEAVVTKNQSSSSLTVTCSNFPEVGAYNLVCTSTQFGVIPSYTIPFQLYPEVNAETKIMLSIVDKEGNTQTFSVDEGVEIDRADFFTEGLAKATLTIEPADADLQIWYKIDGMSAAQSPAANGIFRAPATNGYALYDGAVDLNDGNSLSVRLGQNNAVNPTVTTSFTMSGSTTTGLDSVSVEGDATAPAEYYDLRGCRVNAAALAPGMYIERRGTTVRKVVVR